MVILAVTIVLTLPHWPAVAVVPTTFRVTIFVAVAVSAERVAATAWPAGTAIVSALRAAASCVFIGASFLAVDERSM